MARNSNSDARKARSVTIKYNRDGTKTRLLNGKIDTSFKPRTGRASKPIKTSDLLATTSPTESGGTVTVTKAGLVTERDAAGRLVSRYQTSVSKAESFNIGRSKITRTVQRELSRADKLAKENREDTINRLLKSKVITEKGKVNLRNELRFLKRRPSEKVTSKLQSLLTSASIDRLKRARVMGSISKLDDLFLQRHLKDEASKKGVLNIAFGKGSTQKFDTFQKKVGRKILPDDFREFKLKGKTPLSALRSEKLDAAEEKTARFVFGAEKEVFKTIQDKPFKLPLVALGGAALGFGSSALASVSSIGSTVASVGGKILGVTYLGGKIYEYKQAPTPELKGAVFSKAALEIGAFTVGGVAGGQLAIKKGFEPLPSLEPKLKFETFKANVKIKGEVKDINLFKGLTFERGGLKGRGGVVAGVTKGRGFGFGVRKVSLPKESIIIAKTPAAARILSKSIPKESKLQADLGVKLFRTTQFSKSKFYKDALYNSKILKRKDLNIIYDFARGKNTYLYGSASAEAQKPSTIRRAFGDIDLQLVSNNANLDAKSLAVVLGKGFRVSKATPTLIEKKINGKWSHAVDIHNADGSGGSGVAPERIFGFFLTQKPFKAEGIKFSKLSREGLAKGSSLFTGRVSKEGDFKFYPEAHRTKDIADFFTTQEVLLRNKGFSSSKISKMLDPLKKFYSSAELSGGRVKVEFVSPKVKVKTSLVVSPLPSKSPSFRFYSPSLSPSRSPSRSPSKSPSPSPRPKPRPPIPSFPLFKLIGKSFSFKKSTFKPKVLKFTTTIIRPKKIETRLKLFTGAELR